MNTGTTGKVGLSGLGQYRKTFNVFVLYVYVRDIILSQPKERSHRPSIRDYRNICRASVLVKMEDVLYNKMLLAHENLLFG